MQPNSLVFLSVLSAYSVVSFPAFAEAVRLPVTADIWLSDANAGERNTSMGAHHRLKLKSHQELVAMRFDVSAVAGREVKSARLFLRKIGEDELRWVRLSTVNADWVEGRTEKNYGPADGATWFFADANAKRAWAWPGSAFCDVIMTSGHSVASYAEKWEEKDDWISVEVAPELVYAMVAKDTDGLAVMDGGNLALHNNFFYSREQRASAPYVLVEAGEKLPAAAMAAPKVVARAAPESAHLTSGAVRVEIAAEADVVCYRVTLNGKLVPRWKVPHPRGGDTGVPPVVCILDDLAPATACTVEVTGVTASGEASPSTKVSVAASLALAAPPKLRPLTPPVVGMAKPIVWVVPPLVKVSPDGFGSMAGDLEAGFAAGNSVFDGRSVVLAGARGEYVSFQVVAPQGGPVALVATGFAGESGRFIPAAGNFEFFGLHLARNQDKRLQPAYAIPLPAGEKSEGPFAHVDFYIPKDAKPGEYAGALSVGAGDQKVELPIRLTVYDFALPDELSFWPELNGYSIPKDHLEYFGLAQRHRCVPNFWRFTPRVRGTGADARVDWAEYDRDAGPLLSGEAFKDARRGARPIECMYLPYGDSWPTELTRETYRYAGHWPGRGEDRKFLVEHSMTAPPIETALSADYLAAFAAVQRQFVAHFKERGWDRTEMQCFFGGKQTHRIDYGSNYWWTTDEPAFFHDWMALRYFDALWTKGLPPGSEQWVTRADISRPQWQGTLLDGVTRSIYFGTGATSPDMIRRVQALARQSPLNVRFYGSCNRDTESNLGTIAWELSAYLNGAQGVLPWQTLGKESALDDGDASASGGNALLVPARRFKVAVVADLRLKAMRDGQQLIEYLHLLGARRGLNREQLRAMVTAVLPLEVSVKGGNPEDADALRFAGLKDWQVADLKRQVAGLIVGAK